MLTQEAKHLGNTGQILPLRLRSGQRLFSLRMTYYVSVLARTERVKNKLTQQKYRSTI
jgi:hypothetical protein